MKLREWFKKYARGRGIGLAKELKKELQHVLSKQAPTRVTRSGRLVAKTRAKPFAPPRRVTGKLQASVEVYTTKTGAGVVVNAPYGMPLEKSKKWYGWPHKFVAVALKRLGIKSVRGHN